MLSDFDLGRIKQVWVTCGNVSEVSRQTGFARATICRAIGRHFKRAKRAPRISCVVLERRRALRVLARKVSKKGHLAWPTFSSSEQLRIALSTQFGLAVGKRQIQRDLHAIGFKPYIRPRHATRRRADAVKRLAFAKKHHRTDWKKVVFSDESWLCCNERTGRVHWCKKRSNVLAIEKKARWNVASIMIWGAIGFGYKSDLVIFPSKHVVEGELRQFRLNAKSYTTRCLRTVVGRLEGRLLQQDGARSHAAVSTTRYLKSRGVQLLEMWPPYSPDLNAIERIWKELHARVGQRCPLTVEELTAVAQDEWRKMPQALIDAHCRHFPHQLRAIRNL
jgi:transposase